MKTLGIDLGSSSVKISLLDVASGMNIASLQLPKTEMEMLAPFSGWAEQHPEMWWQYVKMGISDIMAISQVKKEEILAIGIAYQMHGLVCVDKNLEVLRPSIIWCDSRAVSIGVKAFCEIGKEKCLTHLLNSPGNFTASKLAWVKNNEPLVYSRIYKIMLPGDYIAMKLTGEIFTTKSGLSEGILWDFKEQVMAGFVLDYFGISPLQIPSVVPTFGNQGSIHPDVAKELGLSTQTKVTYRAGDQPNNAFSLNVLNPGEIAATAGTSGVVYGVTDQLKYDPPSRINTFLHVNHKSDNNRLGVLLCINGAGILNSWMKKNIAIGLRYDEMNEVAANVPVGSEGLVVLPFGNGAERILQNQEMGAHFLGLDVNRHSQANILRATHEGIAFAFHFGMKILESVGIKSKVIHAGNTNMFLSPVFRQTLASIARCRIQLYNTDGALGAARGAAVGAGLYTSMDEAFAHLQIIETINPETETYPILLEAYNKWNNYLLKLTQ